MANYGCAYGAGVVFEVTPQTVGKRTGNDPRGSRPQTGAYQGTAAFGKIKLSSPGLLSIFLAELSPD